MSLRFFGTVTLLAAALWCAAPLALAQDVTIKQVYQAAESGKLIEAQAMIDKVLRAHPNSGRAHFIRAELLARQGRFDAAGAELANAERLAPGLSFAKPEALRTLRALLAGAAPLAPESLAPAALPDLSYERQVPMSAPAEATIPWGMLILVGGLAVAAFLFFRNRTRRQVAQQPPYAQGASANSAAMGSASSPYAATGMGAASPVMGAPGGGIGSGIMGGLATGAALGAGMVAGQALMHQFTDGNRPQSADGGNHLASNDPLAAPDPLFNNSATPPAGYDMGGDDFGVADSGSWDSGDSGGGGEWD